MAVDRNDLIDHHNSIVRRASVRSLELEDAMTALLIPIFDQAADEAAKNFSALAGMATVTASTPGVTSLSTMICVMPRADQQAALAVSGGELPEDIHCTLCFLGEYEGSLETLAQTLQGVAATHAPLVGEVGGRATFSDNGNGAPSILLPDVPGLVEMRVDVTKALHAAGIEFMRNHGFTPHLTLGYGIDAPSEELLGNDLNFDHLMIVRGNVERHHLPLTGGKPLTAAGGGVGHVPASAHYRPAPNAVHACATCSFYGAGMYFRCGMYDTAVKPDYVCDEWAVGLTDAVPREDGWGKDDVLPSLVAAIRGPDDEWPFGLRCMDCGIDIEAGEPYEQRLVEDWYEIVCPDCANLVAAGEPPAWTQPASSDLVDVDALVEKLRAAMDPVRQKVVENVMKTAIETAPIAPPAPTPDEPSNVVSIVAAKKGRGGSKKAPPVGISYDVTNPLVQQQIKSSGKQITAIAEGTRKKVASVVGKSYAAGLSVDDAAKNLRETMRSLSPARARLIARTELAGAVNGGSLAATQLLDDAIPGGLSILKVWLTAPGAPNPRHETYAELDGQTQQLQAAFDVGGQPLQYPGDPTGDPGEVCNCRCSISYTKAGEEIGQGTAEDVLDPEQLLLDAAEGGDVAAEDSALDGEYAEAITDGEAADHLDDLYAGWPSLLSTAETDAFDVYTLGNDQVINEFLRTGKSSDVTPERAREMVATLDSAIAKAPKIDTALDVAVFRGVHHVRDFLGKDPVVGDVFTEKGFMSTTTDEGEALFFAGKEEPTLFEILLPKGSTGAWIPAVKEAGEDELLLPRGLSFRVTDTSRIEYPDGHTVRVVTMRPDPGVPVGAEIERPLPVPQETVPIVAQNEADLSLLDKPWQAPPPPKGVNIGKGGAGGYTSDAASTSLTETGRIGEAAFQRLTGGQILHAAGEGEKSPLDVLWDHRGFEVKATWTDSSRFAAWPKPYEIEEKLNAADDLDVQAALSIVVLDRDTDTAYIYYRDGLKGGRLSERTGWHFMGTSKLSAAEKDSALRMKGLEEKAAGEAQVIEDAAYADPITDGPAAKLLDKTEREWGKSLTDDELEAFQVYQYKSSNAVAINRMLRGKRGVPYGSDITDKADATWFAKQMDSAIARAVPLSNATDVTVFRGVSDLREVFGKEIKVGQRVTDKGFISTTTDLKTAVKFEDKQAPRPGLIEITVPVGERAAWMRSVLSADFPTLRELVLARNSTLEVESVEIRDGKEVVRTRLIPKTGRVSKVEDSGLVTADLEDGAIVDMPVASLIRYRQYNVPRRPLHAPLEQSIAKRGFTEPVELDVDNKGNANLSDGNHRLSIAIRQGIETVPVRINRVDELRPTQNSEKLLANDRRLIQAQISQATEDTPLISDLPKKAKILDKPTEQRPYGHLKTSGLDRRIEATRRAMRKVLAQPEMTGIDRYRYERWEENLKAALRERELRAGVSTSRPYAAVADEDLQKLKGSAEAQLKEVRGRVAKREAQAVLDDIEAEVEHRTKTVSPYPARGAKLRGEVKPTREEKRAAAAAEKKAAAAEKKAAAKPGAKPVTMEQPAKAAPRRTTRQRIAAGRPRTSGVTTVRVPYKPPKVARNARMKRLQTVYKQRYDSIKVERGEFSVPPDAAKLDLPTIKAAGADFQAEVVDRMGIELRRLSKSKTSGELTRRDLVSLRRDTIAQVLSEIRPLNAPLDGISPYSDPRATAWLRNAAKFFPKDWGQFLGDTRLDVTRIEGVSNVQFMENASRAVISLDDHAFGSAVEEAQGLRVSLHELGHIFERVVPHLSAHEAEYFAERTPGEASKVLAAASRNGRKVFVREDKWVHAYMGRDYSATARAGSKEAIPEGTPFEILSMGMEGLFTGSFPIWESDPETAQFILGLLAAL